MPCCKAEYFDSWCITLSCVDYRDVNDNQYCIFHAPADQKGIPLQDFNSLVVERIMASKRDSKECLLSGVIFPGDISFAQFNKDNPMPKINFFHAQFMGEADFIDCVFMDSADFGFVKFHGQAYFLESCFMKDVSFCRGVFQQLASFEWSKFNAEANFHQIEFLWYCYFDEASFLGKVVFDVTKFSGDTSVLFLTLLYTFV